MLLSYKNFNIIHCRGAKILLLYRYKNFNFIQVQELESYLGTRIIMLSRYKYFSPEQV